MGKIQKNKPISYVYNRKNRCEKGETRRKFFRESEEKKEILYWARRKLMDETEVNIKLVVNPSAKSRLKSFYTRETET